MTRFRSTFALVASTLILGCSADDSGDLGIPGGSAAGGAGLGGAAPGGTGPGGAGLGGAGQGGTGDECPAGVICVESLPYTDANTTVGGAAVLDGYSCGPDINESGPQAKLIRKMTPSTSFRPLVRKYRAAARISSSWLQ